MCGVYGILDLNGRAACGSALAAMAAVTVHRGPDDEGQMLDGPLALGMRRLSIIDVGGGHQPIANEDETVWVVCNGEIYNFRQLRKRLEEAGHRFRTSSDSEVVVHLYEQHGDAFVEHLDGMFGFALWDVRRRRLLIARDRLGIKPMYVSRDNGRILFASEMKAILGALRRTPQIDPVALREYLSLGYVPSPLSIFVGVTKLAPGTLLVADANSGHCSEHRYWHPTHARPAVFAQAEWIERTRAQLQASVSAQMVSDVPLGAFLSGGIDSSAVVAMMARESSQPVRTYSIGFDDADGGGIYNELAHARRVATLFGTDHHEIIVRPQVAALLPKLLWHLDEPVADSAFVTTHLVSELAAKDVKVILSGVGGDELFGGYRRYLGGYYARILDRLPSALMRHVLVPLARRLPSDRHSNLLNTLRYAKAMILSQDMDEAERYRSYVGVFPDRELDELMAHSPPMNSKALVDAFASIETIDDLNRLMEIDLVTQFPDDLLMLTDRMTMASSIECRVPLVDQALVDLALSMPSALKIRGRELKHVLKLALRDVLPADILHRGKRGFGAPVGAWFKQSLSKMTDSVLSEAAVRRRGWFNPDAVTRVVTRHRRNEADHTDHILALTNFEIFNRIFVDGRSADDVAAELMEAAAS